MKGGGGEGTNTGGGVIEGNCPRTQNGGGREPELNWGTGDIPALGGKKTREESEKKKKKATTKEKH